MYTYRTAPSDTPRCAITGGTFYNPPDAYFPPSYVGDYFFADFCSDWISVYDPAKIRPTGQLRSSRLASDIPLTFRSARTGAFTTSPAS